jgi:FMN reductase
MRVSVVVGNPKSKSRTLNAGLLGARKLTGKDPDFVLDVADLGGSLLEWGNATVTGAIASIQQSDVVIVGSPTYKATYTGLLKLFLDQIPADGLKGIVGLPMMLGAGPAHALAPELLLKPVLVELGAVCPVAGLYLSDKTYEEDQRFDAWADNARQVLSLFSLKTSA